jgi:hypothetical protein
MAAHDVDLTFSRIGQEVFLFLSIFGITHLLLSSITCTNKLVPAALRSSHEVISKIKLYQPGRHLQTPVFSFVTCSRWNHLRCCKSWRCGHACGRLVHITLCTNSHSFTKNISQYPRPTPSYLCAPNAPISLQNAFDQ